MCGGKVGARIGMSAVSGWNEMIWRWEGEWFETQALYFIISISKKIQDDKTISKVSNFSFLSKSSPFTFSTRKEINSSNFTKIPQDNHRMLSTIHSLTC
jgi:hypothetical protein